MELCVHVGFACIVGVKSIHLVYRIGECGITA